MPKLTIQNFRGGLNKTDGQSIDDDQFVELKNMFYNKAKRIQTRRGVKTFGKAIPEDVTVLNACDATTNFAVTDDATTLAAGTAIRGTNSVSFTIDVSNSGNDYATLTNASIGTVDISTGKGYLGFWMYTPAAFNTNLTDVKVRLGSDSSNYYEWTLDTLTEASNNFVALLFSAATTTGTPVDTSIDYFRLQVTYTASYTDKTGVLIDDIQAYSADSTLPVTSYFFHQLDSGVRIALAACGTNMFHYNESNEYWDIIKSGLTKFETATGRTTEYTRWSFAVYLNVVYMCNGVDAYQSWNQTVVTEHGAEPKPRYLKYMGDRVFGAGADAAPHKLYFTAALAADATNLDANNVIVGGDEQGVINGLKDLGKVILAGKSNKIYSVDVATPAVNGIDTQNGWYSNRSIKNVGNSLFYLNDSGINTLKQRSGVDGGSGLESEPITDDIRDLTDTIEPKQYNSNAGLYSKKADNYYFTFDGTDDNIPETTVVYSSLVGAWSQYTYPALYDYGTYTTSTFSEKLIAASANGGQCYELETGFDDLGGQIDYELKTKEFDMGDPSIFKDYLSVDIYGFKSEGQDVDIEIFVDGESAASATLDDTFLDSTANAITIGTSLIGTESIGGGEGSTADIDIFPYKIRIPMFDTGSKIQVKMSSSSTAISWTLDRIRLDFKQEAFDIFPISNIA